MIEQSATACAPLTVVPAAAALDEGSFGALYEQHVAGVYRYMSSRVGAREEAEDLTADAFRAAWTSRHAYRGHGTFRAWLYSIARRTLADHYRRLQPAGRLEEHVVEGLADEALSPEELAVRNEQHYHTRQLLAGLSPAPQEVLSLRFAAELTYPEIAVVIGKREEAVKKIAQRALEAIRGRQSHAQPF